MTITLSEKAGLPRLVVAGLGAVTIGSVFLRFMVPSALWLDEALSVNIAELPLGDIGDALRSDGHPPLYYWLLHGWMNLFGSGDVAVRALSGVISLITIALFYMLGSRLKDARFAMTLAMVAALSPFAFRYGAEARMYSLMMLEVVIGYLLVLAARDRWSMRVGVGIALVTAALLWTHYWSMWLLIGVGLVLLAEAFRNGRHVPPGQRPALRILLAAGLGAITFVPWLETLLYQNEHTGTPWAEGFRPATLIVTSIVDFAGGPFSEPQIMMMVLVVLFVLGIAGRGVNDRTVELGFAIRTDAVGALSALAATAVVASAVGLATGIAFAPRYASIYFAFFAVIVALGLHRLTPGVARTSVFVLFGVLSVAGIALAMINERSQAPLAVQAITAETSSGLIVTCPDQLGPATHRELGSGTDYELVTYPRFADPRFVDWVDYEERNAAADPEKFAAELLVRAGDRPIVVVWREGYLTLEGQCARLLNRLSRDRAGEVLTTAEPEDYYEPMSVTIFR